MKLKWEIRWTRSAFKTLQKLQRNDQKRVLSKLEEIQMKPYDFIQKLTNRSELKLRVGNIRLFIELDRAELMILILKIGQRKNIYKKK